jgi:hypothetical protein
MSASEKPLADDLLEGAGEIAGFIFGNQADRRKVYHLLESKNAPPHFRLRSNLCARKSALLAWVAEQEAWRPQSIGRHLPKRIERNFRRRAQPYRGSAAPPTAE